VFLCTGTCTHPHTDAHSIKNLAEWIVPTYMFWLLWLILLSILSNCWSVEYTNIVCVCVGLNVLNEILARETGQGNHPTVHCFWVVNLMIRWEFEFGLWLLLQARCHYYWCWSHIEWWCFIEVVLVWWGFKAFKWKIFNLYSKVIELVMCSLYRHMLMCCWVMPPISCSWKQKASSWCVLMCHFVKAV